MSSLVPGVLASSLLRGTMAGGRQGWAGPQELLTHIGGGLQEVGGPANGEADACLNSPFLSPPSPPQPRVEERTLGLSSLTLLRDLGRGSQPSRTKQD